MNLRLKTLILLIVVPQLLFARGRSGSGFEFLDLPTTARATALGGQNATIPVDEASFFFQNPAVLRDTLAKSISLSVAPITTGIVAARACYVHDVQNVGMFAVGGNFLSYGKIDAYDEYQNYLGTQSSQEGALYLSYARALTPHWTIGATIKPIFSTLAGYTSVALAMDLGFRYVSPNQGFTAGVVLNNLGGQITKYDPDGDRDRLDCDLAIGCSYKIEHAPFRFSLTLKDIFHWDLSVDRSNKINFFDNLLRHTLWGVEFVPAKVVWVAFGYNHRMQKELRESSTGGAAGICWGCGATIAKIDISYGNAHYHKAGSDNVISISTSLGRFLKHN